MGFRNDGFLTVWEVKPTTSKRVTRAKVSSSKKNRDSDTWDTDFSAWVKFLGNAAEAALKLKQKDRIVAKRVEVQNEYNKEEQKEYTDFIIWEFDMADAVRNNSKPADGEPENPAEEETPF